MLFKQYEIWIANLDPQYGTESGKIRPVLIVQSDFLNCVPHSSVIVCPITTNVVPSAIHLRVHLKDGIASLHNDSDIMIDQIRAIDTKRLMKRIGKLPVEFIQKVKDNILTVLNLEL